MPYCPKCRSEYRDGFTVCEDCDTILVGELPADGEVPIDYADKYPEMNEYEVEVQKEEAGKVKPQPSLSDEVALTTVDNQVELVYITSELENENIPYRIMERDIGNYLAIYFGTSYMGKTIFVDGKNLEKAKEIVESVYAEIQENNPE
ncbi:MAG: DUF2007 domain-containing protein [Eubacteriales bacterium]